MGVEQGLVLNKNISMGGSDIFAMIYRKYFGLGPWERYASHWFYYYPFFQVLAMAHRPLFTHGRGDSHPGIVIDFTIDGINTSRYCIINTEKPDAFLWFFW